MPNLIWFWIHLLLTAMNVYAFIAYGYAVSAGAAVVAGGFALQSLAFAKKG